MFTIYLNKLNNNYKKTLQVGKVAHTYNSNIQEAEKGSELEVRQGEREGGGEQTYKQFSFW